MNDEMLKPLLEGKTIKQTIDEKRLFIVDLAILEGAPAKSPEFVVSHQILSNYSIRKCVIGASLLYYFDI